MDRNFLKEKLTKEIKFISISNEMTFRLGETFWDNFTTHDKVLFYKILIASPIRKSLCKDLLYFVYSTTKCTKERWIKTFYVLCMF